MYSLARGSTPISPAPHFLGGIPDLLKNFNMLQGTMMES